MKCSGGRSPERIRAGTPIPPPATDSGDEISALTPTRPLTPRELSVADLVGRGYSYWRVALALGISPKTARNVTDAIADALPNPDHLPPQTLVMLWAAHRRWLNEQVAAA